MTANQRGSLFMVAAMAGFAVEDMFIKSAAKAMPLGQVLALMGALGILWFSLQSRRVGEPAFPAALRSRTMLVRSSFEMVGRLFYSLAIALTPISVASAILQATPLVVVAGAALIFGERVGLWRWALTALGFAGRDLATRAAPPALSNAQLGVAGFAVLGLSGLIILGVQGGPVLPDALPMAKALGAAAFGILGYSYLTRAMRTGEVSAVTPFRYTRLLFALLVGVVVFGERPDLATLIGSAMIVGCGVLILTRR